MASSTPARPSTSVSSAGPAFGSSPAPSIVGPTAMGEGDGDGNGHSHDHHNGHTHGDSADDDAPFRFDVDDLNGGGGGGGGGGSSSNPHAEALLRRSPSPAPAAARAGPPLSRSPSPSPSPSSPYAHAYSHSHPRARAPSPLALARSVSRNRFSAEIPAELSPGFLSPNSCLQPGSFGTAVMGGGGESLSANEKTAAAAPDSNPFNFQTQFMSTSPVKSSNIGMRRGHRYKHSSVSAQHQIFQEPPPRPPPVLPASLPVPTVREAWASMQRDQRARFAWCVCHAAVASLVFWCASDGGDSLALTALSHLVFFDVGSAAVCVAVDVLGNFEVWRRSTVRHPFGLRRAEVLAGFAMSIFLVFGGFDLLSHDLKDCMEAAVAAAPDETAHLDIGSHGSGGHHHHARYISPGTVDLPALAAFLSTLVSAYGLGNHARIRRSLLLLHGVAPFSPGLGRSKITQGSLVSAVAWLTNALSSLGGGATVLLNPFHFLTMAASLVLLVLPLLFVAVQTWLDRLLCALIALCMLVLGARLATAQGLMLLMSYSGKGDSDLDSGSSVSAVLDEIASEPPVARVEDAQFWQVHYGLCMATLRVRVAPGYDDDGALQQLRTRIARVVQNRLGEGYGRGNSLRWEVTVQTSV